jgi:hypothetical protein
MRSEYPDVGFVVATSIAVHVDRSTVRRTWGMAAATSRHRDHKAVGVNSSDRPGPDRKMLRNACAKKDIILFDYPVPFPTPAAYIRHIPPLIDTRT